MSDGSSFSEDFNVSISSGSVIFYSDYIKINSSKGENNSGLQGFKYNDEYGFLSNSSFGNIATIKFYLTFNFSDYVKQFPISSLIDIIFELKYSSYSSNYLLLDSYNENSSVNICIAPSNSQNYFDSQLVNIESKSVTNSVDHSIIANISLNFSESNPNSLHFINFEVEFNIEVSDLSKRNEIFQNEFPFAKYILKVS